MTKKQPKLLTAAKQPKLLTAADAAKILEVTPERVTRFCRSGRLTAQYLCTQEDKRGVWILFEEDVKAFARIRRHAGRPAKEKEED